MSIKEAYNNWAETYDDLENKTRDLDKVALEQSIKNLTFEQVLEMGCGTGKNTPTLLRKAKSIIGFDFSEKMLAQAREK